MCSDRTEFGAPDSALARRARRFHADVALIDPTLPAKDIRAEARCDGKTPAYIPTSGADGAARALCIKEVLRGARRGGRAQHDSGEDMFHPPRTDAGEAPVPR